MTNIYWNEIKQLDTVLDFFVECFVDIEDNHIAVTRFISYTAAYTAIITKYKELNEFYFQDNFPLIINKLVRDKYLSEDSKSNNSGENYLAYTITFEGKLFSQSGGYGGKINRQNAERIRVENIDSEQKENQKNTLILTVVLAVGQMGLFAMEIIKMSIDKNKEYSIQGLNLVMMSLVFFFGIASGIIIYLAIPLARQRMAK